MSDEKLNLSGGDYDEANAIVVAGVSADIGTRVIRWDDPKGFDGYTRQRVEFVEENRRTGKKKRKVIVGPRYGRRKNWLGELFGKNDTAISNIRQFFIHHSGGDGREPSGMYETLYNRRRLSVHFAVEDDGRIYQFNDVADKCWHAGKFNNISVGVECCLYPLADRNPEYYSEKRRERTGNLPHEIVEDIIHGRKMNVFAFTEPQVEALSRLAAGTWAALAKLSPKRGGKIGGVPLDDLFKIAPKFPRDKHATIPRTVVQEPKKHVGLIGHLQVTRNKIDPAGFPWEKFEGLVSERFSEFMRGE